MIEEYGRAMSTAEWAELQSAMQSQPPRRRQPLIPAETWGLALVAVLTLVIIALAGGNKGGLTIAGAAVVLVVGYQLVAAAVRNARNRKWGDAYMAQRHRELALVLERQVGHGEAGAPRCEEPCDLILPKRALCPRKARSGTVGRCHVTAEF
jgi:hypothetical protein